MRSTAGSFGKAALVLMVTLCAACDEEPTGCTLIANWALAVTVVDSTSMLPYRGSVTAVARAGSSVDSLQFLPRPLNDTVARQVTVGTLGEGIYSVEIRTPQHVTWRRDGIRVRANGCTVTTESLTALLQRAAPVDTVVRDTAAAIQTDATWYALERRPYLGWETTIRFTFRNKTADTIHVNHCGRQLQMGVEKLVAGQWRWMWNTAYMACQSPPIVIPPGGKTDETFAMFGAPPNANMYPYFFSEDLTGVYRLTWGNLSWQTAAGEVALPAEHRTSNLFFIKRMDE